MHQFIPNNMYGLTLKDSFWSQQMYLSCMNKGYCQLESNVEDKNVQAKDVRQSCLSGCPCYSNKHYIRVCICYFTLTKYSSFNQKSFAQLETLHKCNAKNKLRYLYDKKFIENSCKRSNMKKNKTVVIVCKGGQGEFVHTSS